MCERGIRRGVEEHFLCVISFSLLDRLCLFFFVFSVRLTTPSSCDVVVTSVLIACFIVIKLFHLIEALLFSFLF